MAWSALHKMGVGRDKEEGPLAPWGSLRPLGTDGSQVIKGTRVPRKVHGKQNQKEYSEMGIAAWNV